MFVSIIIVLIGASICSCANILAIIPTPSYSHQVAYQQIWRELSLRGHMVTVVTTNPIKDPSLTNLTEIDMSFIYKNIQHSIKDIANRAKKDPILFALDMTNLMSYVLVEELKHPAIRNLIKKKSNQTFDVVLVEFIFPAMYAFAEVYQCPLIAMSSMDITPHAYHEMGNPVHSATHPNTIVLAMAPPLSFWERLKSTLFNVLLSILLEYLSIPRENLIVLEHFGDNMPHLRKLIKNISLIFVNTDPIFHDVIPLVPAIIPIGGESHIRASQPLPTDLERFIESATEEIIYFSLGSNVQIENIGASNLKHIIQVFKELPYKVIWKFNANYTEEPSSKLYLGEWLPQQTILQNPKIKLFITQGGCQSLGEAVYNHVPILGIPFFADQYSNVMRMVSKGVGLSLDYATITKQSFKDTVLELMNNPTYRNRVKDLANLARDQPMTGLERAVWWTEYVIRHKGAQHLKSPFIDLPNYQYYHLDVIAFCLIVVSILVFAAVKIFRLLLRLAKCITGKSTIKQKVQ